MITTIRSRRNALWLGGSVFVALVAVALVGSGIPQVAVAQTIPSFPDLQFGNGPQPAVVTALTAPTEPTDPTDPTAPTAPTSPTAPTDPTDPTAPTSPTAPTAPTAPTPPTLPDGSGTSTQSVIHIHKYVRDNFRTAPLSLATTTAATFPFEASVTGASTTTFTLGSSEMTVNASTFVNGVSYTATEVNSTMASSSSVIASGGACVAGHWRTVGYRTGSTLSGAASAALTATAPSFTNLSQDAYLIVVNEYCVTDNMPPTTGGGGDTGGTGTTTASTTQVIVVHPEDLATSEAQASSTSKWFFWNGVSQAIDPSVGTFVTGPGTAPLGTGSVMLAATSTGTSAIATYQFGGTRLSDITALSFQSYLANFGTLEGTSTASTTASTTPSANAPFIGFAPLFSGNGSVNGQLIFLPQQSGTVATGTWQTWNLATSTGMWGWTNFATSGNMWPDGSTNQFRSWTSLLSAFPNLTIGTTSPLFGVGIKSPNASTTVMAAIDDLSITIGAGASSTATTTIFDFEPTAVNSGGNGGGGGGGGGGSSRHRSSGGSSSSGEVLGASCPLITSWMREGQANDSGQVTVLQSFLNDEMDSHLSVSGFFDSPTTSIVNDFQVKYWQDVLAPWVAYGLPTDHTPTGYVYKTTSTKINRIACPDMTFPDPVLP